MPTVNPDAALDAAIDSSIGQVQKDTNTQVNLNLQSSVGVNADKEAANQNMAAVTATPLETVRNDPETVQRQIVAQQTMDANLAKNFPNTARFFGNIDRSKVAHDDIDNLTGLEYTFSMQAENDAAKFGAISSFDGVEASPLNILRGIGTSLKTGFIKSREGATMQLADLFGEEDVFLMSQRAFEQAQAEQDFVDPAFRTATGAGLYSGGQSLVQNAPGIALSIATANPAPGLALAGAQTQTQAYGKYRNRGATPGEAFVGGTAEGAIEVATEMLPMGVLVDNLGKVGAGKFLKEYLGKELVGEELATLTQDAVDTAIANPDKTWGDYLKERPQAAYQTALATLVSSGALTVVNEAARYAQPKAVRDFQLQQEQIANINERAKASKLRTRDPLAFEQFVEQATEGGPVENLYVSPEALAQSGIDPAELAKLAPSVAEQLIDAPSTGTDIRIPTSEFATYLAGTPTGDALLDHLKTSPQGFSKAEAALFQETQGAQLQSEVERVLAENANNETFNTSRQVVQDDIFRQLTEANRFTPDVNTPYATLVSNIYATMAARTGMTPEEFYKQHPLNISAELPGSEGRLSGRFVDTTDEPTIPAEEVATAPTPLVTTAEDGTETTEALPPEPTPEPAVAPTESALPAEPQTAENSQTPDATPSAKITDFGEKIEGARKDAGMALREALKGTETDSDIASQPLSKSFPAPDYAKLAAEGVSRKALALVAIARSGIPTKPQRSHRVARWVREVKNAREFANLVLEGNITPEQIAEAGKGLEVGNGIVANMAHNFNALADIIKDADPKLLPQAAKFRISRAVDGSFIGYDEKGRLLRNESGGLRFENIDEIANAIMAKVAGLGSAGPARSKYTEVSIFSNRKSGEISIGFKNRGEYVRVKGGFADVKEARAYLQDKRDEIQDTIDQMRAGPNERRDKNSDRVGPTRRPGDVTPEMFDQAFGFRGVQFGNFVEGSRRQQDLNEAYDALMDLAEVLGIPPKALSLNGELALAFGARGKGGKGAAKAHYEPGQIVINLTKETGAGSLAHEWLHGLDNYFARKGGNKAGYASKGDTASLRPELAQAWKDVMKATRSGEFLSRSREFDAARSKPYFSTEVEMAARSFERYALDRIEAQGGSNDYLINVNKKGGAYPTEEEMVEQGITDAWDKFFGVLETRETERGVELYQRESLPKTMPIADLLRSEDGSVTARNGGSATKGPVAVTLTPEGYAYVLNGYHRIQDAIDRGETEIAVEWHDFEDLDAERLANEKGRFVGGKKLYQNDQAWEFNRGAFLPTTNTLVLLKNADLSTFLHETGHFMLEMLNRLAIQQNAPQELRDDMDVLLKRWDVEGDTAEERLANWNTRSLDEQREKHEEFARSFEAYLFEGKAPSVALKGIFNRLRAWLVNIYRQLTALNVELSDDVRGVFDRLLATTDQIKEAEALRAYAPMFANATEAGMTDEEFKAYHELGIQATQEAVSELDARTLRDMKWLSNAKGRELKRLQKEAAVKRAAVRREVTTEVMGEPINRAIEFIKRGTLDLTSLSDAQRTVLEADGLKGTKLSLPALKELYGNAPDAPWRLLATGQYGFVANDGLPPQMVAEMFGFSSADQLVQAITSAENPKEKIDAFTDMRMLERYGDLTDTAAMERAAEEAIHNEARTKFIAAEMAALNKAAGKRKVLAEAARGYAEQLIARLKIRNVYPNQYTTAEARAGRAAEKARRAGDIPLAATEKRNQLINNYAARAAGEALHDVDRGLRYLAKFDRKGTRESIDADYLDQIDAILERFDLRRSTSLKAIDKRKSLLDWVKAQEELGFSPSIPDYVLNEARRLSFKEMTVEEFRGMLDTIKQIDHIGRLKHRLLTAQDQRNFEAARDAIVNSINENAPDKAVDLRTRTNAGGDLGRNVARFLSLHRKMASLARQMDGQKDGGPLWDYFIRTMNTAGDKETVMRSEAVVKMRDLMEPLLSGERMGGQGRYFPSIGMSLNREERIGIALNMGNTGNIQRLLDGEGWTMAQLQPVLDTLTKEEARFVQNIWDFFESYRPEIAAKERRVYGTEPEWVQPQAITLGGVQLKGGYYPVKYDPQRSGRAQEHADAEDARQMLGGAYTSATTRRSFTKARSDEVKGRPLLYSMSGLYQGVNEVIHDLSWHEWLIDVNRLLRSKAIDGAMRNRYGADSVGVFKDAIKDIARGDVPAQDAWESSLNHIRSGATIAGLGWNFTTSLLQPLGLTNSMVRIGPKWVTAGMRRWLAAPFDVTNEIYEKSDMMRLRSQTMNREIAEIRNRVSGQALEKNVRLPGGKVVAVPTFTGAAAKGLEKAGVADAEKKAVDANEWLEASFFYTITKAQLVADIPTWLGQYEKSIAEGVSETKAVDLADQAVLDAQGGGQIKDLSAIQRGGPIRKLFTNFYSYFNVIYNLTAEVHGRTNYRDPASVAIAARDYLLLYIVPSVMGTLVKEAFSAVLGGGDDDDKRLVDKIISDQISYLFGTLVGVRELTGVAQTLTGTNLYHQSSYQGPAGLRLFNELFKLGTQVSQGDLDAALRRSTLNSAGILFHLPSGQINKALDGGSAFLDGKAYPTAVITGP